MIYTYECDIVLQFVNVRNTIRQDSINEMY